MIAILGIWLFIGLLLVIIMIDNEKDEEFKDGFSLEHIFVLFLGFLLGPISWLVCLYGYYRQNKDDIIIKRKRG